MRNLGYWPRGRNISRFSALCGRLRDPNPFEIDFFRLKKVALRGKTYYINLESVPGLGAKIPKKAQKFRRESPYPAWFIGLVTDGHGAKFGPFRLERSYGDIRKKHVFLTSDGGDESDSHKHFCKLFMTEDYELPSRWICAGDLQGVIKTFKSHKMTPKV